MSDQQFTYGVAQNLTANTFTRDGYSFNGWNMKTDGTGTTYTNGQSVQYLTATDGATVTLYAQWTQQSQGWLTRLAGGGRYSTMGELVSEAFPNVADTVIVSRGENYPDALAASGLSGVLGAPIMLTNTNELSVEAAEQLERLQFTRSSSWTVPSR